MIVPLAINMYIHTLSINVISYNQLLTIINEHFTK